MTVIDDRRATMARDPHLENAIMELLWSTDDWLTPGAVRDQLAMRPQRSYTTVMTVLTRLWKKGRLERERRGRAFAYHPVHSRSEQAALRMEEILHAAGDRSTTLARFLTALSASERREMRKYLEDR